MRKEENVSKGRKCESLEREGFGRCKVGIERVLDSKGYRRRRAFILVMILMILFCVCAIGIADGMACSSFLLMIDVQC